MSYRLRKRGLYGVGEIVVTGPAQGQTWNEYYAAQLAANPETQGWDFSTGRVIKQQEVYDKAYQAYTSDPCSVYNLPAGTPCDDAWRANFARRTSAVAAASTPSSSGGASYSYTPAVSYAPQVRFNNSRQGSTVYPGDTWTIAISGGQPNADVTVTGGKNGEQITTRMGATDGAGNFSLSGKFSSSEIGNWSELWKVGGQNAGSFTFSVVSGPGGSTATTSASSTPAASTQSASAPVIVAPVANAAAASSASAVPPGAVTTGGSIFSTVPWWVWLAGGGLALYAFSGGQRGR